MMKKLWQLITYFALIMGMVSAASAKNLVYENNWAYLADTVMGGVSQGSAEFAAGALRLTGKVSTKNNGGFIQVRTRIDPTETIGKSGIKIKVKGNGDVYYLHVRNASARLPWHYYTASFKTSEKWKDITISFDEFEKSATLMPRKLKPESIKTIGLVAYGKDHEADVSIANLEFY
ncbi:MAG: CIA30 family protein [Paracoccaceae bacterium]